MNIIDDFKALNLEIKVAIAFFVFVLLFSLVRKLFRKKKDKKLIVNRELVERQNLVQVLVELSAANKKLDAVRLSIVNEQKQLDHWKAEKERYQVEAASAAIKAVKQNETSSAYPLPTSSSSSGYPLEEVAKGLYVVEKPKTIPYVKTPWNEVNSYLYSICDWGEPSAHAYDDDSVLLPWASKSDVEFKVGDITYTWGRMDDEDFNDNTNWWSYLTYDHPILNEITIINKLDEDANHIFRNDDGDTALYGGQMTELRADQERAVKQGLTALYLWLKNERVN